MDAATVREMSAPIATGDVYAIGETGWSPGIGADVAAIVSDRR
jgi:hypothetical protein